MAHFGHSYGTLTFVGQAHNVRRIEVEGFQVPDKAATGWVWGPGIYLGITPASERHYARLKLERRGAPSETLEVVAQVSRPFEITLPRDHTWPPGGPNAVRVVEEHLYASPRPTQQERQTVEQMLRDAGFDALVIRPDGDIDCFWAQMVVFDRGKLSIVKRRTSLMDESEPAYCDVCWRPARTRILTCGSPACEPPTSGSR